MAKFKRKTAKRYEMVSFNVDFIEGTFELPKFTQLSFGIQRKLNKGDFDPLTEFIEDNSGPETVNIIDTFDSEEMTTFISAWSNASGVEAGK